jgi:hypothetical protein
MIKSYHVTFFIITCNYKCVTEYYYYYYGLLPGSGLISMAGFFNMVMNLQVPYR